MEREIEKKTVCKKNGKACKNGPGYSKNEESEEKREENEQIFSEISLLELLICSECYT